MGTWVALILIAAAGQPALETRYFDSASACEAWAARITAPAGAPDGSRQVAGCFHVRELIARLAQGR